MSNSYRRLSVPPLAGLEGQGCRSLGGGSFPAGVSYSLCQGSSTVSGTHAHAFLRPHVHQGGCSGGGHSCSHSQGCGRTGSFAFSWLLQLSLCGVEDLGVLVPSHRLLASQSFSGFLALQDGDHPVCSSLGLSGGLDGVHRPEGSLLADSSSSGVSQVSMVCGFWPCVSIPGSLFRPHLSSSSLHMCYGSGFINLVFHGYTSSSLFRRLVNPVLVSGGGSSRPPGGPRSLHGARDCSQSREVQFCSIPEGTISGNCSGLPNFGGFSIPGSNHQAAVSRRRISILRSTARRLLAISAGHSVFSHPSGSGWQASYEVSSVPTPPELGSSGGLHSGPLDSHLSPRPPVVVRRALPSGRVLSRPGLPGPRLLVRRLERGLGGSFRSGSGFRPLVSRRGGRVHQRSGTSCRGEGSPPFPVFSRGLHGGDLRGQLHGGSLSPQIGGYPVSLPQRDSSEDSEVVGASRDHPSSAVHSGQPQCNSGLSLSSSSVSGLKMDSLPSRLSRSSPSMASDGRPVCHLSKSPLFCIFLSLPGSSGSGDRCVSPVLGRSSSIRLPSLVHHSTGPGEAACFSGNFSNVSGSVLAPEAIVSRAPGLASGSSGGVTVSPRPSVSAPVGSAPSRSPQASTSCLETLRRFTRAAGFSSGVASQVGLARRASSRTNYQLKWSTFRSWCRTNGHSISCLSVSKVADFLLWFHRCRGLSVSSIMRYRSMLLAVFQFQLPDLSSHPVLRDLLRSFRLAAPCRPLRPPAWDLAAVLMYLNSAVFEPLRGASLRNLTKKVLFLLALATAKRVGELQALSRSVSFVHADACVSYVPEFVAKTESLSNPIPRSFLVKSLSDFAAGLQEELLLCPVLVLHIYLDRSASFSPLPCRLFLSPRRP